MELSFSLLAYLFLISNCFLPKAAIALRFHQVEGEPLSLARSRTKIFHPPTGVCVLRHTQMPLNLGPCDESDSWNYTPQKFLTVGGTYFCLQPVGLHQPVTLSIICMPSDSAWEVSSSYGKSYFSTVLEDGTEVCLDVDGNGTVITNPCNGGGTAVDREVANDSQWFKLIKEPRAGVNN